MLHDWKPTVLSHKNPNMKRNMKSTYLNIEKYLINYSQNIICPMTEN